MEEEEDVPCTFAVTCAGKCSHRQRDLAMCDVAALHKTMLESIAQGEHIIDDTAHERLLQLYSCHSST